MATRAKILLIEGKSKNVHSFGPELREKDFEVTIVHTGRQVKEVISSFRPDVMVMDTTSFPSSGVRICKMARMMTSGVPLILRSGCGSRLDHRTPMRADNENRPQVQRQQRQGEIGRLSRTATNWDHSIHLPT